ncbi:MAG: hypothetical protein NXI10_13865 [bacterium]|nr:hypothetical protein [bacterium]
MNFLDREQIDTKKWDELVRSKGKSFFSYSWYLDAVAENWCILVNDDYSQGIALPFTKRLGVEILYVPIFSRFLHPMGEFGTSQVQQIQERFSVIEFATTTELFGSSQQRVHQIITDFEQRKLSSQAKRSLKKAINSGIQLTGNSSYKYVVSAIEEELQDKFKGVDADKIEGLKGLFQSAKQHNFLKVFEVSDGQETGGIVCLVDETQVLYLKGACPDKLKKNGGMYLALNAAIEFAQEHNLHFDFGGSNIHGVQRFNKNLGGVDQSYHYFESNRAPFWFRWARKLKNQGNR